ncbi:MAG TPA: hypothetical protein ENJ18_05630 [Nannocystis exedens]|nr:hypothetical protein [Nannocystis exedens]
MVSASLGEQEGTVWLGTDDILRTSHGGSHEAIWALETYDEDNLVILVDGGYELWNIPHKKMLSEGFGDGYIDVRVNAAAHTLALGRMIDHDSAAVFDIVLVDMRSGKILTRLPPQANDSPRLMDFSADGTQILYATANELWAWKP